MKVHEMIDDKLRKFVLQQPVFFVGSAPTSVDGHVNISPKGMAGTFAVLDEHRVAYLDHTGSGAETAAHLRDNGRIVLMFCAFEGPPNIVRLHGQGRVVPLGSDGFEELAAHFASEQRHGVRAVVEVAVERVSSSCGYAVPFMAYDRDRDVLERWAARKTDAQLDRYRAQKNARSIDGLPALDG